jgi:putative SOS response-associated peptidase YedK
MCAHYEFSKTKNLKDYYDYNNSIELKEKYDVYPGYEAPVATENGIEIMKWGFPAPWMPGKNEHKLFNAKSETLDEKASFKKVLAQRCLIFATSFYEYTTNKDGSKEKLNILLPDREIFTVAGLYKSFKNSEGKDEQVFTMLTTTPNKFMKEIHHRMIVILEKEQEKDYLNTDLVEYDQISDYFKPYQGDMEVLKIANIF